MFDTLPRPQSPEYLKNKNKNSIFKAKIFQFAKTLNRFLLKQCQSDELFHDRNTFGGIFIFK